MITGTIKPFIQLLIQSRNEKTSKNKYKLKDVINERGNIKIPKTTAIFNMSSATDCPSRKLGLCKAVDKNGKSFCYAIKSERANRPLVLPYRRKQEKYWKSVSAEEFAVEFLILSSMKRNPFTAIRFNESGDFHNQSCVNKAEKIARILKPYGIICYCYTSRNDLDYRKVKALRISGSNFKKPGIVNIFKIIKKKEDKPKGYAMCPMDCHSCNRCMRAGLKTAIIKH